MLGLFHCCSVFGWGCHVGAGSEKLSQRGREGAEEITRIVSAYFNTMLDISTQYQGDLLKFGGDALLFAFLSAFLFAFCLVVLRLRLS